MLIGCHLDGIEIDLKRSQNLIPRQSEQLFEKYSSAFNSEGFVWGRYSVRLPLPITRNKNFVFEYHSKRSNEQINLNSSQAQGKYPIGGLGKEFTTCVVSEKGLYGALTLGRNWSSELDEGPSRTLLEGLAKSLHDDFSDSLLSMHVPESKTVLTDREIQILSWAAEGKTASETATILNLSPPTIVFHLKNAMNKLNCSNKIQAAVKATSLGILRSAA